MLRTYNNELKDYNFLENIKEGYFLDAKDENRWKVGQVESIRKFGLKYTIEVKFDGYPYKYNESYELPSYSKLAPFRKHSLPYTGSSFEVRRQQPSKSVEHYLKALNKLEDISGLKAEYINQFVRGELFIFVDYILTVHLRHNITDKFEAYKNFLFRYLQVFEGIMNRVIDLLPELQEEGSFEQKYIYVSPKMALLYSMTEFLFSCNSLVSRKEERVTFHKNFSRHQSIQAVYALFQQKVNSLKLYEKSQKLMKYRGSSGRTIPWSIRKEVLILMRAINKEEKFVLPTEHKQIVEVLEFLPYFAKKGIITKEESQKGEISLLFTLLVSGNFEGKLTGLNEIKKILSYRSSKVERMVSEEIKEKNIIEFLTDNHNFNAELFKRALPIFEFAYKTGIFSSKLFPTILMLSKDKHELELKNFYQSISQFGVFLSEQDVLVFFSKILELPFEENFIDLVKQYTIAVIDHNPPYKKIYMTKEEQGLGVVYLWDLITKSGQETKQMPSEVNSKAIEAFATLLNNLYYAKQVEKYIILSIKAIRDSTAGKSEAYLKIIHESLKFCKGSRMSKAIEIAEREVNIMETVMNVLKKEGSLSDQGVDNLFEFLEEVNYISRKGLSTSDLLLMWEMGARCRRQLLKFMRKYRIKYNEDKSHQKVIHKALEMAQIEFILKRIVEDPKLMEDYRHVDLEHFQTIDELIVSYLHHKRLIVYNYKHTIRFKRCEFFEDNDSQFLGMKFYLRTIEGAQEEAVQIRAARRLIEIFLRPESSEFRNSTEAKVRAWLKVTRLVSTLKKNKLQTYLLQLQEIYGRMKSLNILEPDVVEIRVRVQGRSRTRLLSVPRYTSLWKLRLLINEQFELADSNFEMELVEQRTRTTLEREEDLSVAFITLAKDAGSVSVLVHPSKEQHPHFKAIDLFKDRMSDMLGEKLYQNLSSGTPAKVEMSSEILAKIPFIKSLEKSLKNLEFKTWDEVMDPNNMRRLEYQLSIIHKVKDLKWIIAFLQKGGIGSLATILQTNCQNHNHFDTLSSVLVFFKEAIKFHKKEPIPFKESFLSDILVCQSLAEGEPYTESNINYLWNCFGLIQELSSKIKVQSLFRNKEKVCQVLEATLLSSEKKSNVASNLLEICKQSNQFEQLIPHISVFLTKQKLLVSRMFKCRGFFELVQLLINRTEAQSLMEPLQQVLSFVRKSDIRETNEWEVNYLLYGFLMCLLELLRAGNTIEAVLLEDLKSFQKFLLGECLFHEKNVALCRFKSKELRQLGFGLLETIQLSFQKGSADEKSSCSEISRVLTPLMTTKCAWRQQHDWGIEAKDSPRSSGKSGDRKFMGLKNLAATCYINSLLQQLFYIREFSHQIMMIDSDQIKDEENIVREIQNIFGFLKYSEGLSYTTESLCRNFILDGQPIDPRVQTDVDEFFHTLIDKVETNLNKIDRKELIFDVFRGELSNLIIGQQCPHTSERIEHFLSIRLEIKDKKTIYQALDEFIKGEILEGENAYHCEKCDKKVKAMKRVCLKNLPPTMIVTLKRFEFDFDTMEKFKLNSYCSFPDFINFLSYTKEGLQEETAKYLNKQDYEYRLKGIIIHYGVSEAGHYTSYVRTSEDKWTYFDDERISNFDLSADLEHECYGGIEENPFGEDEDKKKNAYILIYEKASQPSESVSKVPSNEELSHSKIHALVQEDNTKNKVVNILFDETLQNFMLETSDSNSKAFLIYYHTVFLRNAKNSESFKEFFVKCEEIIKKDKGISRWYLSQITDVFLLEFVVHARYKVKLAVTSLIHAALLSNPTADLEMIQQCASMLHTKSLVPLVRIFPVAYHAPVNDYSKYLNSINFSEVVINISKGKEIKETNIINKLNVRDHVVTEFGNPVLNFTEKKTGSDYSGFRDAIQAIEGCKSGIGLEDVKELAFNTRNRKSQRSLASVAAKRFKDLQSFKQLVDSFISPELFSFDPKAREEFYFEFVISLVGEIAKIKDEAQQNRCMVLAQIYFEAIKVSLGGFLCELMLLKGFVKLLKTNLAFRKCASMALQEKENKRVLPSIKDWLKGLPKAVQMIRDERWGWWRKIKKVYHGITLKDVESQVPLPEKETVSFLNAVAERHEQERVPESLIVGDQGHYQQNQGQELVKVTAVMGLMLEVKTQSDLTLIVSEDEVIKKYI